MLGASQPCLCTLRTPRKSPWGQTFLSSVPLGTKPQCGPSRAPGICLVPPWLGGQSLGLLLVMERALWATPVTSWGKPLFSQVKMVTWMRSVQPHLILTPLSPSSSAHLPKGRFPDTEKASSSHFCFSPLGTFDREILSPKGKIHWWNYPRQKQEILEGSSKGKIQNYKSTRQWTWILPQVKGKGKKQGQGFPPD